MPIEADDVPASSKKLRSPTLKPPADRDATIGFNRWMDALEARHLSELRFSEVSRALRALSSLYVERRHRLGESAALATAGKRAAFALFYGPLHYLLVREIVSALPGAQDIESRLVDLGCGSGASGAAWAGACVSAPALLGVDRHPWVLQEAELTYRDFGMPARLLRHDVATAVFPRGRSAILAAFVVNELTPSARDTLLRRLTSRAAAGDTVLVVEPLARFVAPWWTEWRKAFESAGGRADEWRMRPKLPPIVAKLDRAAGMDHTELSGRSLWLQG